MNEAALYQDPRHVFRPGQQRVLYFVVDGEYDPGLRKLTPKGRLQALATGQILTSWGLDPTSIRVATTTSATSTAMFIVRYFLHSFIEGARLLQDITLNERGGVVVSDFSLVYTLNRGEHE